MITIIVSRLQRLKGNLQFVSCIRLRWTSLTLRLVSCIRLWADKFLYLKSACGGLLLHFVLYLVFTFFLIIQFNPVSAQKTKKPKKPVNTTVGFQYCPIIPNKFIGPVQFNISKNNVDFSVKEKMSYFGGMEIRFDFTDLFALQTGINYEKRNFEISVHDLATNYTETTKCKFIGYGIPTLGLIYIRLSEHIYMNNSFGFCFDFFPTDIKTNTDSVRHYSIRNNWVKSALLTNVGWEWRTNKIGYFYLGASYKRLFTYLLLTEINYNNNNIVKFKLPGHYFAINIKYFFPKQQENIKPKNS